MFGTHLEVDYLDNGPAFLCQYIGETSTQLADLGAKSRYNNDSFNLGRTADNPMFSNCTDPARCNKVVSFAVDFAIESQGMFNSISLDQSEFKNTSESMEVTESMGQSVNDKSIKTQGLSLFNVYKSRSYTCTIKSLGNVCIQPTMYFTLRNVPMFNGPYIILKVDHTIQANNMVTSFTGVRVPFHKLPDITNLIGKINKTFIKKIRKKVKSDKAKIAKGGFDAESSSEISNVKNGNKSFTNNTTLIKFVVVHVTAGLDYGSDPIGNINKQHLNKGFSGIGYHYVISRGTGGSEPDGTLYGARPDTKRGAHVLGHNSDSIGVSMIANCDVMGKYESDSAQGYATQNQKHTLEWTILYILFKKGVFSYNVDTEKLTIRTSETIVSDPTNTTNSNMGVTTNMWREVVKGHNEFANKRCPCYRVQQALDAQMGKNLRQKLSALIKESDGSDNNIILLALKNRGFKYVPSPFITNTPQEELDDGNDGNIVDYNQYITPPAVA